MNKLDYGPAIGSHLGKTIYKFIKDQGKQYNFDRLAQCDDEGCSLHQVKKDEILVAPGLIYKQAS